MDNVLGHKDSGIEWVGDVPFDWKTLRLRHILKPSECRSVTGDEELLSITIDRGVVKRSEYIGSNDESLTRAETLVGYKFVQKTNLVNNIMKMSFKCLGVSRYEGIVSPAYSVFEVNRDVADPRFLHELLRIDLYVSEYRKRSKGIQESRMRLYDDYFLDIKVALPPLHKQALISKYLGKRTSQIDSLIEKFQRKIELLKEQRTALINQCVTKGLYPNVEMKISGVEWIGEIPRHWEIGLLKHFCSHINIKRHAKNNESKISPENVESGTGKILDHQSDYKNIGMEFEFGDTLLNKLRVYLAKVVFCELSGLSMGEMIVLRPTSINPKFQFYLLSSCRFIDYLNSLSEGVKMPRTPIDGIMKSQLPITTLREQSQISQFLDRNTSQIDSLSEKLRRKIELLKEYRQSLISNVVTGKVKVTEDAS